MYMATTYPKTNYTSLWHYFYSIVCIFFNTLQKMPIVALWICDIRMVDVNKCVWCRAASINCVENNIKHNRKINKHVYFNVIFMFTILCMIKQLKTCIGRNHLCRMDCSDTKAYCDNFSTYF